MKQTIEEINELRTLVKRTEKVVDSLGRLIPEDDDWLAWRHRGLVRKLDILRRELHLVTERVQVMLIEKVVEDKREVK
jgi:hypothetical protein